MTRFRAGLILGFAGGYYLGARAGRQRYEQINRLLRRSRAIDEATTEAERAKAIVELTRERVAR
jgi:type VI protein secretion system component VasF